MGEPETPPPPRKRRRRWPIVCLLLVGAPIAGWLWWYHSARREYRAEIDAIRQAGEPLTLQELAPQPLPDELNAAELYKEATATPLLAAGGKDDEEDDRLAAWRKMLSYLSNRQLRRQRSQDVAGILAAGAPALALCREARSLTGCDWKIDLSGPAISIQCAETKGSRDLGRLLTLAALSDHEARNDAKAVGRLRDALALSKAIAEHTSLLSHLVMIGLELEAHLAAEEITAGLRIGRAPAAGRKQVEALITDLLDESALRRSSVQAWMSERAFQHDTCERALEGDVGLGYRGFGAMHDSCGMLVRPFLLRDAAWLLRRAGAHVAAARQPCLPTAMDSVPGWPQFSGPALALRRPLSILLASTLGRAFVLHFRAIAMRRMAATALAIRLYQLDQGRRPGKLDDLLGKYLPAVPADPFSRDGRKIGYLPRADKPLLYCVNENGADDGGQYTISQEDEIRGDIDVHASPDLPWFLDGARPQGQSTWKEPEAD